MKREVATVSDAQIDETARDVEVGAVVPRAAAFGPLLALPAIAALALETATAAAGRALAFVGLFCAGVALNAAAIRYVRTRRVTVRDGRLMFSSALGERLVNPRSTIVKLVRADFSYGRISGHADSLLLFVDSAGRAVFRLYPTMWDERDLERIRAALGVPLELQPERMTAARLRRTYPRAMPWPLAHLPAATILGLVAAGVVVAALQPT